MANTTQMCPSNAKRILLVEDNAMTRKVVQAALSAHGYFVDEAVDGREALQAVTAARPDLIIQDLMLPDIDGNRLVKLIRESPGMENVPILAFSAYVYKLDEARSLSGCFNGFVPKPVEPSRLVAIVGEQLALTPNEERHA